MSATVCTGSPFEEIFRDLRRGGAVILILVGMAWVPGGLRAQEAVGLPVESGPVPAEEIEARRDWVFRDSRLQTELPGWQEASSDRGPARQAPPPRRVRRSSAPPLVVGRMFQWVVLALGAVVLILGLVWLSRDVLARGGSGGRRSPAEAEEEDSQEGGGSDGAKDDLDTLVEQGSYGEAIHLLLLRAVDRLERRTTGGRAIPAGRTSREVWAAAPLEARPREALGELVMAVERYLFGGRDPGPADFDRCRRAFGTVERALVDRVGGEAS